MSARSSGTMARGIARVGSLVSFVEYHIRSLSSSMHVAVCVSYVTWLAA